MSKCLLEINFPGYVNGKKMHELSLAQNIFDMIIPILREQNAARLTAVELEVGRLSGVEVSTLKFALERLLALEHHEAKIIISEINALIKCQSCKTEFEPEDFVYSCPTCGACRGEVLRGKEMRVSAIEVA